MSSPQTVPDKSDDDNDHPRLRAVSMSLELDRQTGRQSDRQTNRQIKLDIVLNRRFSLYFLASSSLNILEEEEEKQQVEGRKKAYCHFSIASYSQHVNQHQAQ